MSEFAQFADYSVVKKYEGAYGRWRILTILSYIFFPIILLLCMIPLFGADAFMWVIPFCITVLAICVPLTYNRYYKIEYDYRIAGGELIISEIYNKRRRKEKIIINIAAAEMIAPFRDKYRESAERLSYSLVYEAASSMNAEDLYFAVVPDEDDYSQKTIVFFEPNAKMLSLMSHYNKRTVAVKVKF